LMKLARRREFIRFLASPFQPFTNSAEFVSFGTQRTLRESRWTVKNDPKLPFSESITLAQGLRVGTLLQIA